MTVLRSPRVTQVGKAPPREIRGHSGAHQAKCHVCRSDKPTGLWRDPLGWYLLCCDDPACSVGYEYIMRYRSFLHMRKMHDNDNRQSPGGGFSNQGVFKHTEPGQMGVGKWDLNP